MKTNMMNIAKITGDTLKVAFDFVTYIVSRRYKCIGVIDQTGKSSFGQFVSARLLRDVLTQLLFQNLNFAFFSPF